MDTEAIWNLIEQKDPGSILARDTAANTDLIKKLFDGQWLNKYVRLYVWESARAAGLDDEMIMNLVNSYDNYASQCAINESQTNFDSWYKEYREMSENE